MTIRQITRRTMVGTAMAWGAAAARAAPIDPNNPPPLKSLTAMPVGCALFTDYLRDPDFTALLLRNFSQVTPESEMKMGMLLERDGAFNFARADNFMSFARGNRLRVHGHTLVWYAIQPPYFMGLDGSGKAFADAYEKYIGTVMGRYRGQIVSWDVVNEPVAPDGDGLRNCVWSKNLGAEDYILRAFDLARQADPGALLFMNDYNLEKFPKKRATFLALTERLLKRGAKIDGIGTQCHIDIDLPKGASASAMRDLAGLGLKVHISELDVSFGRNERDPRTVDQKRQDQAALTGELLDSFMALPASQRYALTLWGLRDRDSFLRKLPGPGRAVDQPLMFDDSGRAKPMLLAVSNALQGARAPR